MPTTRRQAREQNIDVSDEGVGGATRLGKRTRAPESSGAKERKTKAAKKEAKTKPKPTSKSGAGSKTKGKKTAKTTKNVTTENTKVEEKESETIERGHIYFFYRPKVQHDEAHSLDDVKNFQIVLVPRPPEFAASMSNQQSDTKSEDDDGEMKVIEPGADAVPAPEPSANESGNKKKYRLIAVGKKTLPEPHPEKGGRRETFWGTVTGVGDDLGRLERGLGEREYETKTRGTRHEAPARLVARGGYALVTSQGATSSSRETHLGYHVSHPADIGDVQASLGIYTASSFVLQVKNPLAPSTIPGMSGSGNGAEYPEEIMEEVFGKGGGKGREKYGLKFASCERAELLDYEGAELLLIASRDGEGGLEVSLGDGRGEALSGKEREEGLEPVNDVFRELGLDMEIHPVEPLKGEWI